MVPKSIEAFHRDAQRYLDLFNAFAVKHTLVGSGARSDHICYKCGSYQSFESMRSTLERNSAYIYQSIISGRRIAIVRLKIGLWTSLGSIDFVELSDQKPDNSQRDGFDHIEVYSLQNSYEMFVKHFENKEKVIEVVRPHHTTHDIDIGEGFLFRCTEGPLIEKIKRSEMI